MQGTANKSIDALEDSLGEDFAGAHLHLLVTLSDYVDLPRHTVRHWERRLGELVEEADDNAAAFLRAHHKACKALVAKLPDDENDD